ncbi:hypothetical protein ACF0H5_002080 [Mactra antiquata]
MQTTNFSFLENVIDQNNDFDRIPPGSFDTEAQLLKILEEYGEMNQPHTHTSRWKSCTPLHGSGRLPSFSESPHYPRIILNHDSPHRLVPIPSNIHNYTEYWNKLMVTPKLTLSPFLMADNQKGTPCVLKNLNRPSFETLPLTTPMLISTLDNLQIEAENDGSCEYYPDLLQLIDNDYTKVEDRVSPLIISKSEKTTEQNINQQCQNNSIHEDITTHGPSPQPFRKRRKYLTKPMTEEERLSIERQTLEKAKMKRRNKFKKPPEGTIRKSNRERKKVVRYSSS